MKKLTTYAIALLVTILAAVSVQALKWERNISSALRKSRQMEKPVLVIFSNPSHDSKSDTFEKKIISTFEFKKYAAKNLITVKYDIGRPLPKAEQLQLKKLLGEYGVRTYPAVVLVDSNNKKIGMVRIGEDPNDFLTMLKSIASRYEPAEKTEQAAAHSEESPAAGPGADYPERTWTSTTGKKVQARLVSCDHNSAVLVNPKGMKCTVSRGDLSKADNTYLDSLASAH